MSSCSGPGGSADWRPRHSILPRVALGRRVCDAQRETGPLPTVATRPMASSSPGSISAPASEVLPGWLPGSPAPQPRLSTRPRQATGQLGASGLPRWEGLRQPDHTAQKRRLPYPAGHRPAQASSLDCRQPLPPVSPLLCHHGRGCRGPRDEPAPECQHWCDPAGAGLGLSGWKPPKEDAVTCPS